MTDFIARIVDIINIEGENAACALQNSHGIFYHDIPNAHAYLGNVIEIKNGIYHRTLYRGDGTFNKTGDITRWVTPNENGITRAKVLRDRHIIKRAVRDYFHEQGFVEMDMPLLVNGTTPDPFIESFRVNDKYLTTSTEFHLRRLEVGGFDKIYSLTQNFRKGDTGRYRNPEFTMLEWDRVGASLRDIENDVEYFTQRAALYLGLSTNITYQDHKIDITSPWDRITVRDAIQKYTGIILNDFGHDTLQSAVDTLELRHNHENPDAAFLFTLIMDHVQQFLGFQKPVFINEWPLFQTSTANGNPLTGFSSRSECIICGIELSNGFDALTNATEQKSSFENMLNYRRTIQKDTVKLDESYLNALAHGMPDESAMALGFDRLVMILTNQNHIRNVMTFYDDEL